MRNLQKGRVEDYFGYVPVAKAADILRVSPGTIRNRINKGTLAHRWTKKGSRDVLEVSLAHLIGSSTLSLQIAQAAARVWAKDVAQEIVKFLTDENHTVVSDTLLEDLTNGLAELREELGAVKEKHRTALKENARLAKDLEKTRTELRNTLAARLPDADEFRPSSARKS